MSKNVLIIETAVDGHRGFYLKWIVQSFLDDGHKVIVAIPEEHLSDPSFEGLNSENLTFELYRLNNFNINKWPKILGLVIQEFSKYIQFKALYRRISKHLQIDFVFIPYIDHIFYTTSILGSPFSNSRYSCLSMRPDFHYKKFGLNVPDRRGLYFKEYLFKRFLLSRKLVCLLTLDEPLFLYCSENFKNKYRDKIRQLPEPVDILNVESIKHEQITQNLKISLERKKILVYGRLTKRKGIIQLIESILTSAEELDLQLVLAGSADNDIREYLSANAFNKYFDNERILFIDKYLSCEEESVLFSSAYISWLGYLGHYRASGVLIASTKYSVPVVATNQGIIDWQVGRYELGKCIDSSDTAQIVGAIRSLCTNSSLYQKYVRNSNKAFTTNTLKNAKRIIVQSMGENC